MPSHITRKKGPTIYLVLSIDWKTVAQNKHRSNTTHLGIPLQNLDHFFVQNEVATFAALCFFTGLYGSLGSVIALECFGAVLGIILRRRFCF